MKMNENRKAAIIDRCLAAVQGGEWSVEDCLQRYPRLSDELRDIFRVSSRLGDASVVGLAPNQLRAAKMNLLNQLPDRDLLVTKPGKIRYRLQTTKRRFAMTWVIIVSTILSLMTGTGAVLASSDALPGDALYGVKTLTENVQLMLGSDETDLVLFGKFLDKRVQEMEQLIEQGRLEDLEESAQLYQNQTQTMTKLMAALQADDPEEAVRLRTELETKLQEQSRLIQAVMDEDANTSGDQTRDQLRVMLETNNQTRLRINEEVEEELPPDDGGESGDGEVGEETVDAEDTGDTEEETNGNGAQVQHSAFVNASGDEQNAAFTFRISNAEQIGVYAELSGSRYACTADGDMVNCNIPNAVSKGTLNLYCLEDNSLLYSYAYDYEWLGAKENGSGGNQVQGEDSGGSHDSGQSGKGGK